MPMDLHWSRARDFDYTVASLFQAQWWLGRSCDLKMQDGAARLALKRRATRHLVFVALASLVVVALVCATPPF